MANWNDALENAKQEFPDPFNHPNRTQKGRAWHNKKNGMIEPSSAETVRACKESLAATDREVARLDRQTQNIKRHAGEKEQRRNTAVIETDFRHGQETTRRYAKHQARIKNPNRFDVPAFLLLITFCCGSGWLFSQFAMWLK